MTIRILLADDHLMLRDGLRAILKLEQDMELVGEAADGNTVVNLADTLCPDVVVMDIGMPGLNGVEATRQITHKDKKVKVIALSTYTDKQYVLGMLAAGASGYVIKGAAGKELLQAIRDVMHGRKYLSPGIVGGVVDGYLGRGMQMEPGASATLAPKQRQVLQLVAEGHTSRQIAERMHISEKTVEAHRRNIMIRLDVHNVAELTKYAVREGITTP